MARRWRGGRYRSIRVTLWGDESFHRLSPGARLVLMALMTGSLSNLAGIAHLHQGALELETGLGASEVEAALAELETRPSAARSFIVRDHGVVWVRDQLGSDPHWCDGNVNQQRGVETILGSLPSPALVRKFRSYYELRGQGASEG